METKYRTNDLVRIKEKEYNLYAKDVLWNENVFRILANDGSNVKLSDIDIVVPINAVEPIPIDGVADSCIYYDPALAANIIPFEQPIPTHQRNTSYYVEGFETMHVDGHSLKDEFLSKNFRFVHEVQHWLSEDGGRDELCINNTLKEKYR